MLFEIEGGALYQLDDIDCIVFSPHLLKSGGILELVPHCLAALYPCKGIDSLQLVHNYGELANIFLYLIFKYLDFYHIF